MVNKAVIPAAGLGTRFLPITKAQPKEMLPIIDKPMIQFAVEEAINSGINDILIITSRGKRAVEDYFDFAPELENHLIQSNKLEELEDVKRISSLADLHYVRQKEPKGLGDAILRAEKHVGKEPFAILLGDDIIRSRVACTKQLIDIYEEIKCSVLAVERVPSERISRYGVIGGNKVRRSLYSVTRIVEKPSLQGAPSDLGIVGRYIVTPKIFDCLKKVSPGKNNEIQLTDAIQMLLTHEQVYAYAISGKRYDAGEKSGYLNAIIDFALEREDLRRELLEHLKHEAKKYDKRTRARVG
jgi:UTP--glucose-1-phosphate uridylyltransferase